VFAQKLECRKTMERGGWQDFAYPNSSPPTFYLSWIMNILISYLGLKIFEKMHG